MSKILNFNEFINKNNVETNLVNENNENFLNLPDITELPNGEYYAKRYGHCFELINGEKYFTNIGVLCPKGAVFDIFDVKDGNIIQKYPNILSLPNGVYKARWYCYIFELEDGRIFKTNVGVKCSQRQASWKEYHVINGKPLSQEGIDYLKRHPIEN